MSRVDLIIQIPKKRSDSIIFPQLKLNFELSINNEMRIITPHTPPSDNPSAILRDKIIKRIIDKILHSL